MASSSEQSLLSSQPPSLCPSTSIPFLDNPFGLQVPILKRDNYIIWSVKMKTLFKALGLWDFVENGHQQLKHPSQGESFNENQTKYYKENQQKDATALTLIYQGVEDTIFRYIMFATTSNEAWKILETIFKGSGKVQLYDLWNKFNTLRMSESETIQSYFDRVTKIVNHIRFYGDTIEEVEVVKKILRSLPRKYDEIVVTIELCNDLSTLTMYELKGSLEAHELRMSWYYDSKLVEQDFQGKLRFGREESCRRRNARRK